MAADNKRIAKNTVLLYIRQLFTLIVSFYTSRLTLQVLGETDFGVYATVGGITAFLATVANSLASGTQRFITFSLGRGDTSELNRVYIASVHLHLMMCLALVILGEVFGSCFIFHKMSVPANRLTVAFWVFQVTLLNSCIAISNIPNNAEIIAHEDMGPWAIVQILDSILKLCFVALLFFISWDKLLFYSIALLLVQMINRLLCHIWCKLKYAEVKYHFIWDWRLLRSMLGIAGWTGLSNVSISGFVQGTNLLLNVFFGPIINAANSVAMQAYSGLRSFCSSFQLASNPQIVKLYSSGDLNGMRTLLFSVCKISFFLVFLLSLPFVVSADFVLGIWLKEVPEHAESFFVLLVVYSYSDVLAYPMDIAAQATGNLKKYCSLISAVVLSILPISYYLFLKGFIPESVYYIAVIASWCGLILRLILLRELIGISIKRFISDVLARIVLVAVSGAIIPVVLTCIMEDSNSSSLIIMFVAVVTSILSIFFLGLDNKEKALAMSLIRLPKNKHTSL